MEIDVAVIGGGPAGMMAAASAARVGARTVLLEKNEKLGKKLFLTGHGRCNVTNSGDTERYMRKIWRNPKFVRSALAAFSPEDLEEFLKENGVALKEEDSGRKFPVSDHSSDIIKAFRRELEKDKVQIHLNTTVDNIQKEGKGFVLRTSDGRIDTRAVVIATGGLSYPSTGSTGDGFVFAQKLGHSLCETGPALIGMETNITDLAGLTLNDARITICLEDGSKVKEQGSILFTHTGISGPAVFRLSCSIAPGVAFPLTAAIDLKPEISEEALAAILVDTLAKGAGRQIGTILDKIVPKKIAPLLLKQVSIPVSKQVSQLTRKERRAIGLAIKEWTFQITGTRPISEAIITQGGIPTKELNPKNMESRLVPGLFFAGEVVDVSAMTGGYNLQIAFSMGWKAGREASQYARFQ